MVSTFLNYNLINRDIRGNLDRIASSTQVAREEQYYKDNIGNVKTVDEFVDNYRLYSYAMKAHGLEDMTYAKAFMKKVLESDLTDTDSFANRLTDQRYSQFAAAFQFSSETSIIQTTRQIDEVIGNFKQALEDEGESVEVETAYYKGKIGTITSVDDLLGDERARNYVLKGFNLDTKYWNKDHLTKVLTSDLNDPASYVNTLNVANKSTLQAMAANFNFNAAGTLDTGVAAQDAAQTLALVEAYTFYVPSRTVPAEAQLNKDYYEAKIGSITNVDDLVNDSRMLAYVKTAFGMEDIFLKSTIKNILTSDLNDPNNYATVFGGEKYEALTKAFNFQTDGTIAGGNTAQTAAQKDITSSQYMSRYDDVQDEKDDDLYTYYRNFIGSMDSVDELQSTPRLYDFVLTAFGFDPDETKDSLIEKVLTSDLADPDSFANKQKDDRYRELAAAFNFDADGNKVAPRLAQSQQVITQTAKDYVITKTRFGHEDDKDAATAEAKYYSENIQNIQTASEFVADRRLVDFVLVANGIKPEDVTDDFMKKVFSSDLDDPKSFVNTQEDHRYVEILSSFNFDANGNIAVRDSGIQGRYGQMTTEYLYLQQSLEEEVGEDSAGARLALYFQRSMPNINSAYDILGDTALLEVFRTAFELPAEMSTMDIDKQKALVERYMDFNELQDPTELQKFITRFTAMYDLANETDSSPLLQLFSGSSGSISADTLLSIAQLKG